MDWSNRESSGAGGGVAWIFTREIQDFTHCYQSVKVALRSTCGVPCRVHVPRVFIADLMYVTIFHLPSSILLNYMGPCATTLDTRSRDHETPIRLPPSLIQLQPASITRHALGNAGISNCCTLEWHILKSYQEYLCRPTQSSHSMAAQMARKCCGIGRPNRWWRSSRVLRVIPDLGPKVRTSASNSLTPPDLAVWCGSEVHSGLGCIAV